MLLYVMIIMFCCVVQADDQDLFTQANELYAQGLYQEALPIYKEIEDDHPAVWYNMGNLFYAMQDYTNAYLYWLRAQKYGNAQLFALSSHNIQLLPNPIVTDRKGVIFSWLWWLSKYICVYVWQLILLLSWYVMLFCLYNKRRSWYTVALLSMVTICSLIPVVVADYAMQLQGMIIADACVYNGPNSSFYNIDKVTKGKIVAIKALDTDWMNIVFDSKIGWIEARYIEQI